LLDEKVPSGLAGVADVEELLAHELPFVVADALGECTLDVDGESFWAFDSCFHGCCG